MADWKQLFERLRRAQQILDPRMIRRRKVISLGKTLGVPDLERLYEAAGEHVTLDRDWALLSLEETVHAQGELPDDWEESWIDFAADGCGNALILDSGSREIYVQTTDPPGHQRIAADLEAWLLDCALRLEAEVRTLGPNHAHDLALLAAIEDGSLADARRALDAGASPNAKDQFSSALSAAAEKPSRREILELLLARGADPSLPAWQPPIFRAINLSRSSSDALSIVEILLGHGVSVEQRETHYGKTPLLAAARAPSLPIVKLLLDRGADVDARAVLGDGPNADRSVGQTALVVACNHVGPSSRTADTSMAVAFHLLERGADPNLPSAYNGESPLSYAIRCRQIALVERLLDAGADANRANAKGKRPLDIAEDTLTFSRRAPVDPRIVELLRSRGATSGTIAR